MDASTEAFLILRMLAALVVVLALAVISIRFGLPWLMRARGASGTATLRVEESLPLDRQHRLFVVRWEDRRYLIASSAERVDVLGEARASAGREDTLLAPATIRGQSGATGGAA